MLTCRVTQMLSAKRASVTSTADICAMADADTIRGVFIHSCEARLEAQIRECSQQIHDKHRAGGGLKVVCIAGPTASGKTTFAHKLSLALQGQPCPKPHDCPQSVASALPIMSCPFVQGPSTFAPCLTPMVGLGITASPLTVDHYYLPLDQQPKYKVSLFSRKRWESLPSEHAVLFCIGEAGARRR